MAAAQAGLPGSISVTLMGPAIRAVHGQRRLAAHTVMAHNPARAVGMLAGHDLHRATAASLQRKHPSVTSLDTLRDRYAVDVGWAAVRPAPPGSGAKCAPR